MMSPIALLIITLTIAYGGYAIHDWYEYKSLRMVMMAAITWVASMGIVAIMYYVGAK
jgi:hypothetical protein